VDRLDRYAEDPVAFRAAGMEVAGELCSRLLAEGVPGLHFHSLNRWSATAELVTWLGLAAARTTVAAR
jgi:methylenetetrahydrofolate reductase (NADPH)